MNRKGEEEKYGDKRKRNKKEERKEGQKDVKEEMELVEKDENRIRHE